MRCLSFLLLCSLAGAVVADEPGQQVVVVYNSRVPESKSVAAHYAAVRHVPAAQVVALDLPTGEDMTRQEYRDRLQMPLLAFLETNRLWVYKTASNSAGRAVPRPRLAEARIRYAVLCYGVPLRILNDPTASDPSQPTNLPASVRGRNGAAVDSELTLLPASHQNYPLDGPLRNPCAGVTNAALINPTNGALIVARLDGPDARTASRLVDKALEAETNGLWGRAYFDLRGITNGPYKTGDDWIAAAAEASRRFGFETVVDRLGGTFPAAFPMSQIALYAGCTTAMFRGRSPGRMWSSCRGRLPITCTLSARRRCVPPASIGAARSLPWARRPRWVALTSLIWTGRPIWISSLRAG